MIKSEKNIEKDLFKLISSSTLAGMVSGKVYRNGMRPDGSTLEDIVVKFLAGTDGQIQTGVIVLNIYVPDKPFQIDGKCQFVACRDKLKAIAGKVVAVLRNAVVPGLKFVIEAQNVLREESIKQHYVNIRISWNIQID